MDVTELAGNAVVTAAVTDAWEGIRRTVARLFGRGQIDPTIERRLDATQLQLTAVDAAERLAIQETLAAEWKVRFADLLADYPGAAAELEALVGQAGPGVVLEGDYSVAAGRDMTAHAEHGSAAVNVANAPVTVGPTSPGPANT